MDKEVLDIVDKQIGTELSQENQSKCRPAVCSGLEKVRMAIFHVRTGRLPPEQESFPLRVR
jgi:hypothetical protein